jgi:hypothetical protein
LNVGQRDEAVLFDLRDLRIALQRLDCLRRKPGGKALSAAVYVNRTVPPCCAASCFASPGTSFSSSLKVTMYSSGMTSPAWGAGEADASGPGASSAPNRPASAGAAGSWHAVSSASSAPTEGARVLRNPADARRVKAPARAPERETRSMRVLPVRSATRPAWRRAPVRDPW